MTMTRGEDDDEDVDDDVDDDDYDDDDDDDDGHDYDDDNTYVPSPLYETLVSTFIHIHESQCYYLTDQPVVYNLSIAFNIHVYLAGFLITLSRNGPFASNSFFRPKTVSKVAIIKTKRATIAFFSSPPFLLLALSFSPFLFLRNYEFGASRTLETCLLTLFHSNDCKFI